MFCRASFVDGDVQVIECCDGAVYCEFDVRVVSIELIEKSWKGANVGPYDKDVIYVAFK